MSAGRPGNGLSSSQSDLLSSELHKLIAMADLGTIASSFPSTSSLTSQPVTVSSQMPSAFQPVTGTNNDQQQQQQLAMLQLQMQLNALLPLLQQHINLQSQVPALATPILPTSPTIEALNLQLLQNQLLFPAPPQPQPSTLLTDPAIFLNPLPNFTEKPKPVTSSRSETEIPSKQIDKTFLVPPKSPELRRRKRSRASAEPQVSVLRQLCLDSDDTDVLKTSKVQNEESNRRKAAAPSLHKPTVHQPPAMMRMHSVPKENKPMLAGDERRPMRKIFKEEDLPDTVGPDSPLRHHPKYLNRQRGPDEELFREFEAITTLFMMNGYMPDEMREQFDQRKAQSASAPASPRSGSTAGRSECPMEDFMEQVISRELVTCE